MEENKIEKIDIRDINKDIDEYDVVPPYNVVPSYEYVCSVISEIHKRCEDIEAKILEINIKIQKYLDQPVHNVPVVRPGKFCRR